MADGPVTLGGMERLMRLEAQGLAEPPPQMTAEQEAMRAKLRRLQDGDSRLRDAILENACRGNPLLRFLHEDR